MRTIIRIGMYLSIAKSHVLKDSGFTLVCQSVQKHLDNKISLGLERHLNVALTEMITKFVIAKRLPREKSNGRWRCFICFDERVECFVGY